MRERPILFSAPMVRAILEGRKTQTRRVVKLREFQHTETPGYDFIFRDRRSLWNDYKLADLVASKHNPYGRPGDRLWVRETFGLAPACHDPDPEDEYDWTPIYRATCEPHFEQPWRDEDGNERRPPWKPSIFMPRWASRIDLEVTGVRVERLRAITGRDVLAEGVDNGKSNATHGDRWENMQRLAFEELWDKINGQPRAMRDDNGELALDDDDRPIMVAPSSWASNPFVWVVEFKRTNAASRAA